MPDLVTGKQPSEWKQSWRLVCERTDHEHKDKTRGGDCYVLAIESSDWTNAGQNDARLTNKTQTDAITETHRVSRKPGCGFCAAAEGERCRLFCECGVCCDHHDHYQGEPDEPDRD